VVWDLELTDECKDWFDGLDAEEKASIARGFGLLEEHGPALARPYADTIHGSQHANMKELRVQHQGRPYRVLYCFDPRRTGILLIGGDKTGNNRWYDEYVPTRHKWTEIKKKTFTPEQIKAIDADVAKLTREMSIAELRKAIGLAQATIAESLGVTQGEGSRMERRPDLYISTLRRYVEAMHGELVLTARFSGRPDVQITLAAIEHPTAAEADEERELATAR
jgi:hypothetical protein